MKDLKCISCKFRSRAAEMLHPKELQLLSSNCARVRFMAGERIIQEGALSSNIAYLREGLVKLHMQGPIKEQIIKLVKAPKYLGIPTAMGDNVNHYSVTAITPSEVCFIDAETFKHFLYRNGAFAYEILLELSKSELENFHNCANRVQKQLSGKLAQALLFLSNEIFQSQEFDLPLTREDLADWLDTSRESVSRALKEFVRNGYIDLHGRHIKIRNLRQLETISRAG